MLPLISTFLVTPFVVRGLGAAEYGLFALVLGFVSYSFTFSIARAVTKYVAEYRITNDFEQIENIISATLLVSVAVGLFGIVATILLARVFVADVLLIENELQPKAIIAFYIAAATMAFVMLQQIFSGILQAVGRFDWFSHLTTFLSTILSFGNLILVFGRGDTISLLWWNLGITILGAAAFCVAAKKLLPEAQLRWRFDADATKKVVNFSVGVIGGQIFGNIWLLFERSWITRNFGADGLTFYVVPMTLVIGIHLFVMSLALALMPLASELSAQHDDARLLAIYQRTSKYSTLIIAFIGVSSIISSRSFLGLWLGAEFAERSSLILDFHVLSFGALGLGIVAWQLSDGFGFPARNAWLSLIWLICGVGLIFVLTPVYGLTGAAAARAISICVSTPIFIGLIEKATFGKILWAFWWKILPPLILAGAVSGAGLYLLLGSLPLGWLSLFFSVLTGGLMFFAVLIFTNFISLEERQWLQQFAARAVASN